MEHDGYISEGYAIGLNGAEIEMDEDSEEYIEMHEENERRKEQSRRDRKASLDKNIFDMKKRYILNKQAKVGSTIECAYCSIQVEKTTYHKTFCNNQKKTKRGVNSCKDKYWNTVDENHISFKYMIGNL
jgi:hypothetical protein